MKERPISFNRTFWELKQGFRVLLQHPLLSFNRTFWELKQFRNNRRGCYLYAFNRTFWELKLCSRKLLSRHQLLLIVPFGN